MAALTLIPDPLQVSQDQLKFPGVYGGPLFLSLEVLAVLGASCVLFSNTGLWSGSY